MRRIRDTHYGVRLIVAVVCILLLVTPGVVFAATDGTPQSWYQSHGRTGANGTEVQAIPVPVFLSTVNTGSIVENITTIPTTPVPPVYIFLRERDRCGQPSSAPHLRYTDHRRPDLHHIRDC